MIELTLLGVRGSTPAVGESFLAFGGHTSCVAVRLPGSEQPTLVLDGGTGIRDLGMLIGPERFRGSVLLTHLHWDHVQGLPFSPALTSAGAKVNVLLPTEEGESAVDVISGCFRPPYFPVTPQELDGSWSFQTLTERTEVDGAVVTTARVRHKGGVTLGIRVDAGSDSFAYLPDHDLIEPDPAAVSLVEGVDVLLHDGQYVTDEIEAYRTYGHSTVKKACRFADEAHVGRLIITHHSPLRTDSGLRELAAAVTTTGEGRPVSFARQGERIAVGAAAQRPLAGRGA